MTGGGSTETAIYEVDPSPGKPHGTDTERESGSELAGSITKDGFRTWYIDRQWAKNILNGQQYFNGLSDAKDPAQHSPSQLLKCHRKTVYQEQNAPEETGDPYGIFWSGTRIEEDVILPFLQEHVAGEEEYVTNSIWVDFHVEVPAVGELRIKGATDPVLVNRDAEPILLTEIKTKRTVENVQDADDHHKAQAHAYMRGLSEKFDRDYSEAAVIYVDRTSFDIRPIHLTFDETFWEDTVLEWAATQTTYRLKDELPPGEPERSWECEFCSFRERCGNGERDYTDVSATGFLPLFVYPETKVREYLEYHGGCLTPSLAHHYTGLAEEFGVYDWQCNRCESAFEWNAVDWSGDVSSPPKCPYCSRLDKVRFLSGPNPSDQTRVGGEHGDE